eukprot:m.6174 g.6174  ORF g.6174 m.6174 type:complete len:142 (+) comp2588_c0_seq1:305-730(+)
MANTAGHGNSAARSQPHVCTRSLKSQEPEIRTTLESIRFLREKKEETISSDFKLADNLYASASIEAPKTVCLWLGANVMLEYDIDEAEKLLSANHETAVKSIKTVNEDLDFLRDQITTMEVNMARIYNWDVKERRKGLQAQ